MYNVQSTYMLYSALYQSCELLDGVIDIPAIARVALFEAVGKRILAVAHRECYDLCVIERVMYNDPSLARRHTLQIYST